MDRLKNIWEKVKSLVIRLHSFDLQGIIWFILGLIAITTIEEFNKQLVGVIYVAIGVILINLGTLYRAMQKNQEEILEKLGKDN